MTPLQHAPAAANGTSNKKLFIGIIGLVVGLCLLVALFVGGLIGFVFYTIGHSQAAETAKIYLRRNERLQQDIGEVRDFGAFVLGNINAQNGDGEASLNIKVIGARKTVHATVQLAYRNGRQWIVTGAHYDDGAGRTVMLLNPYDSEPDAEPAQQSSRVPQTGEIAQPTSDNNHPRNRHGVTK